MGQVNVYKNQKAQFPMVYYPGSNKPPPIPFMPIYPEIPTPETGLIELSKAEDSKQKELKRTKRLSEPKLEPWTWSWFFYHLSRYRPMK